MARFLMQDMISERTFTLDHVDFSKVDSVAAMLDTMIEFEQDTIAFYSLFQAMMPDFVDRETISSIIAEENKHVQRLTDYRKRLIDR